MISKVVTLVFFFIFFSSSLIFAQEKIKYTPKNKSPEEIMRYIQQAVDYIQEKGDDAYAQLTDPDGPWVEGEWYIYVNNFKGYVVAHLNKKIVGKNMFGVRDVKGNAFYAQLQANARSKRGYGWTEFWWPKANSTVSAQKIGFVMRVPDKEVWVGTGIYDMKQEDIDKFLKEQSAQ